MASTATFILFALFSGASALGLRVDSMQEDSSTWEFFQAGATLTCAAAGGSDISTQSECLTAYEAINAKTPYAHPNRRTLYTTPANGVPRYCSIHYEGTYVTANDDSTPHWNTLTTSDQHRLGAVYGASEAEYRAICKRESKAKKAIYTEEIGACRGGNDKIGGYCNCGTSDTAQGCADRAFSSSSFAAAEWVLTNNNCWAYSLSQANPTVCPSECTAGDQGSADVTQYTADSTWTDRKCIFPAADVVSVSHQGGGGTTGAYFYIKGNQQFLGVQHVSQLRNGEVIWSGSTLVWDNIGNLVGSCSGCTMHGRRQAGSGESQWEVGDRILIGDYVPSTTMTTTAAVATTSTASKTPATKVFQFNSTVASGKYTWSKPAGVTTVRAYIWGAGGGGANYNEPNYGSGGGGAFLAVDIDVSAMDKLILLVGEAQQTGDTHSWTGGGKGYMGGNGGGLTGIFEYADVFTITTREDQHDFKEVDPAQVAIAIAGSGGGGGTGNAAQSYNSGGGGGAGAAWADGTGRDGGSLAASSGNRYAGGGGKEASGGLGGSSSRGTNPNAYKYSSGPRAQIGGGGGAGWYGGGNGCWEYGRTYGGGGGSSYWGHASVSLVEHSSGSNGEHGARAAAGQPTIAIPSESSTSTAGMGHYTKAAGGDHGLIILEYASSGSGGSGSAAKGDPHLMNLKGEAFDVMQTGNMMLLEIPRGSSPTTLDLALHADIERLGVVSCGPTFITSASITGRWIGVPLEIRSGPIAKKGRHQPKHTFAIRFEGKDWLPHAEMQSTIELSKDAIITAQDRMFLFQVRGLDIAVSQPKRPRIFLDIQVKGLGNLKTEIGGLLGIDDHSSVEEVPSGCEVSESSLSFVAIKEDEALQWSARALL